MKGLGHGAEVFAQSGGLGGAETQRTARGFAIEAKQLCGAGRGTDRTASRCAVEPMLIMAGQDRFGDLAFHFDTDLVGGHQVASASAIALREC